jgi:hypothetical protein
MYEYACAKIRKVYYIYYGNEDVSFSICDIAYDIITRQLLDSVSNIRLVCLQ